VNLLLQEVITLEVTANFTSQILLLIILWSLGKKAPREHLRAISMCPVRAATFDEEAEL
jgi:hypothetical protein